MLHHGNFLLLASLPTSEKIFGVYGAVWVIVLTMIASAVFAQRMYRLLRVLARGRRENRFDHPGERLVLFLKEVMGQSRMWTGESVINWAHPLIFWGFCCFVAASALMFTGGMRRFPKQLHRSSPGFCARLGTDDIDWPRSGNKESELL